MNRKNDETKMGLSLNSVRGHVVAKIFVGLMFALNISPLHANAGKGCFTDASQICQQVGSKCTCTKIVKPTPTPKTDKKTQDSTCRDTKIQKCSKS